MGNITERKDLLKINLFFFWQRKKFTRKIWFLEMTGVDYVPYNPLH